MRILHVVGSFAVGGAEQLTAHILAGFKQLGHEAAAVSLFGPQDSHLEEFLRQREVPVYHLSKRIGFDPRVLPRLGHVLRNFQPDILHSHGYVLAYTLGVATWVDVPGQAHTIHNVAGWDMPWWGRWALSVATLNGAAAVAVSAEVAQSIRDAHGIESVAIPNGIPVTVYQAARSNRQPWRSENGFNQDDLLIVSVARLSPQKNHALLLRALASLTTKHDVQLVLAGDGPLKGALEREAEALGIRDRLHFLGVRNDIPDLLAASDVFALSSDAEGNPLSLMEAMAAGLPTVATAVGGVPELLTHESDGLVVPPGDADALAAALSRLVESPHLRHAMGSSAESKALAGFDILHTVRSHLALYERLAPISASLDRPTPEQRRAQVG